MPLSSIIIALLGVGLLQALRLLAADYRRRSRARRKPSTFPLSRPAAPDQKQGKPVSAAPVVLWQRPVDPSEQQTKVRIGREANRRPAAPVTVVRPTLDADASVLEETFGAGSASA